MMVAGGIIAGVLLIFIEIAYKRHRGLKGSYNLNLNLFLIIHYLYMEFLYDQIIILNSKLEIHYQSNAPKYLILI